MKSNIVYLFEIVRASYEYFVNLKETFYFLKFTSCACSKVLLIGTFSPPSAVVAERHFSPNFPGRSLSLAHS